MKILVIFTLCLISDGGAFNEVTGYSGGGVLIKCKYETKYTQRPKYFCKISQTSCSVQIKTQTKNQWVNSERFSLFDDTKSAEFWVMIRELTVQDTGMYQCGVDLRWDTDIYTPVLLNVIKGPSESREVRAFVKGGINIKCRYENKYRDKPKSFCKIRTHQWCFKQTAHKTDLNSEWSHDGRFSIQNNRSAGFFSVFIRELSRWDTGTYACGVVVSDEIEVYTVVELNVTEDMFYEKSIRETVHVGGDLTLRFKYPDSLKSNPKFVCRMKTPDSACFYKDSVNESRKSIKMGKFVLYDDRAKQHFNVSISNVTEQNSGEYWCGAEVNWTSDHGYKVYFTDIKLRVTDEIQLTPASPPAGFPAYTAITVSVILLLLLIGILILSVTFQRRCRMRDPKTTMQAPKEMNEDYETDLNVFPLQSAQNTNLPKSVDQNMDPNANQSNSVYQTLNPNINQSDSVYQTLNPNTNQSDSDYQTLNLNANQSDSVYQTLNPNSNQSDSVYQMLNPNTNQSDSVYQTLNPNANQSDSAY